MPKGTDSMSPATRRPKRHSTSTPPPPPSTPKTLLFPRTRRSCHRNPPPNNHPQLHRDHLLSETLLDRVNADLGKPLDPSPLDFLNSSFDTSDAESREKVQEEEEVEDEECGGFKEETWRFQAEILRAECNFLRLERDFTLKKLEENKVKMERALRLAVQTLVSGRKRVSEGKNVDGILEGEIGDLSEKLEDLHNASRIKHYQLPNCSNFDTKAWLLQRCVEKLGGLFEEGDEETPSINSTPKSIDKQSSAISNCKIENTPTQVDIEVLSNKMEGGSMDDFVCSSSISTPASNSFRQLYLYQEPSLSNDKCSGLCKAVIRRIADQVRGEMEQWSQMQEMLRQVRVEMEELLASRDFWINQGHNSDQEIQYLKHSVHEWKEKALLYKNKANLLKQKLSVKSEPPFVIRDLFPFEKKIEKEKVVSSGRVSIEHHIFEGGCRIGEQEGKGRSSILLGNQLAKEGLLLSGLKESGRSCKKMSSPQEASFVGMQRCPLRDVGNSLAVKQAVRS